MPTPPAPPAPTFFITKDANGVYFLNVTGNSTSVEEYPFTDAVFVANVTSGNTRFNNTDANESSVSSVVLRYTINNTAAAYNYVGLDNANYFTTFRFSTFNPGDTITVAWALMNTDSDFQFLNYNLNPPSFTLGEPPGSLVGLYPSIIRPSGTFVVVSFDVSTISTGTPFTGCIFTAYDGGAGTINIITVNGPPDFAGLYRGMITGLSNTTQYSIDATLINAYGRSNASDNSNATTVTNEFPGIANAPTLVSKTSTSITVRENTAGMLGTPFTICNFTIYTFDSSNNTPQSDTMENLSADASGNYNFTIPSLTAQTTYYIEAWLTNSNGQTPLGYILQVTTDSALPNTPSKPPTPISISNTSTSLTVYITTAGMTGTPFTKCVFTAAGDASGNQSVEVSGTPDASGNYTGTINGLMSPGNYDITCVVSNSIGDSVSSDSLPVVLQVQGSAPSKPPTPTLVSTTPSSLTVSVATAGMTGAPFDQLCRFDLYNLDGSLYTFENGNLDASGNYTATINDLEQDAAYNIKCVVSNSSGDSDPSDAFLYNPAGGGGSPPGVPPAPTAAGAPITSFAPVSVSTTGVSGDPFTGCDFVFSYTDSSGFSQIQTVTITGAPDASGNYTLPRYNANGIPYLFLNPSTAYTVTTTLKNAEGSTSSTDTPLSLTTGNTDVISTPPGPTVISSTATSLTVSVSTAGISGSPFNRGQFIAVDSSGTTAYPVIISGAPDASGNYTGTITGLSSINTYALVTVFSNTNGDVASTASVSATPGSTPPPGVPPAPTAAESPITSFAAVSVSTTGLSGDPFTGCDFVFSYTDASGLPQTETATVSGPPDASGNYTLPRYDANGYPYLFLNPSTAYTVTTTLKNAGGSTSSTDTPLSLTTGNTDVISTPPAPTLISSTGSSLTVSISTAGLSGSPFNRCQLFAVDSSGTKYPVIISGAPDASGNYTGTITGLSSSSTYALATILSNATGDVISTGLVSATPGSTPPGVPPVPTAEGAPITSFAPLTVSTTGLSGDPFTGCDFVFSYTDASGLPQTQTATITGAPDASGNYTLPRYDANGYPSVFLNPSTAYTVTTVLRNSGGSTSSTDTPLSLTTGNTDVISTPPAPTIISSTATSLTVSISTAGISGSPFNRCQFFAMDSSGTRYPILISGAPDASGNYTGTITDLSSDLSYSLGTVLSNANGDVASTASVSATPGSTGPSGVPMDLTSDPSGTHDDTTISLVGNPGSVVGATSATFTFTDTVAPYTVITLTIQSSQTNPSIPPGYVDASGNYHVTATGLTAGHQYTTAWGLSDGTGIGEIVISPTPFYAQPVPQAPPTASVPNNGSKSANVSVSTTGLTGGPFTGCTFTATDSSGIDFIFTVSGSPDASGNYTGVIPGLSPSTTYTITSTLINTAGSTTSGSSYSLTTLPYAGSVTLVSKTTNSIVVSDNLSTDTTGAAIAGPLTNVQINYIRLGGVQARRIFRTGGSSGTGTVTGPVNDVYTGTLTGLSSNTSYNVFFTFSSGSGDLYSTPPFTVGTNSNPVCFKRGSKILCLTKGLKEEYVPIEQLRKGDLVKTLRNSYVRINLIGKSIINNPDNRDRGPNRLFKLTKEKYPEITEDLVLTGCHSLLVERLTDKQRDRQLQLMGTLYLTTDMVRLFTFVDERAEPYMVPGEQEIWHLALDNDNHVCNYGIYANGLLVETASIKNMKELAGMVIVE